MTVHLFPGDSLHVQNPPHTPCLAMAFGTQSLFPGQQTWVDVRMTAETGCDENHEIRACLGPASNNMDTSLDNYDERGVQERQEGGMWEH